MDTLLILKDTIAVNIIKSADSCKQCIHDIPTNEYDVWINASICITIVLVSLIVAITLYHYSRMKMKRLRNQHQVE